MNEWISGRSRVLVSRANGVDDIRKYVGFIEFELNL
jgi:hypothetical protein